LNINKSKAQTHQHYFGGTEEDDAGLPPSIFAAVNAPFRFFVFGSPPVIAELIPRRLPYFFRAKFSAENRRANKPSGKLHYFYSDSYSN